jgi:pyrroloquinoline-quinone synthase
VHEIFEQLERRLGEYDLLCHPFYRAWSAGELTRTDLQEYAAEYYHRVAAFPTYLSALHSRLPDGAMRRTVVRNLCEEEIEGPAHSELWLDFAEGLGMNRESAKARVWLPHIQELITVFRASMHSPAKALAALYANESQVPRIAKEKVPTLGTCYGADAKTCRYFVLHRVMDQHHSETWKRELTNLVANNPTLADEIVSGGAEAAGALWRALDGIEEARQQRILFLRNVNYISSSPDRFPSASKSVVIKNSREGAVEIVCLVR